MLLQGRQSCMPQKNISYRHIGLSGLDLYCVPFFPHVLNGFESLERHVMCRNDCDAAKTGLKASGCSIFFPFFRRCLNFASAKAVKSSLGSTCRSIGVLRASTNNCSNLLSSLAMADSNIFSMAFELSRASLSTDLGAKNSMSRGEARGWSTPR